MGKIALTPLQRRIIKKLKLMPFTPAKEVAKRFRIPEKVVIARRGTDQVLTVSEVGQFVARHRANPRTAWLLYEHPQLWAYPLIEDMAADHRIRDIRFALRQEAHGRQVPSRDRVREYIRLQGLRTPEQQTAILSKAQRGRTPNRLTGNERDVLRRWARIYFTRRGVRKGVGYTADDMRGWMIEYAANDANYVRIDPSWSLKKKRATWYAYLSKAVTYYRLNAYKRLRRAKKREVSLPEEDIAARTTAVMREIRFASPLTARERRAFELLSSGLNIRRVAQHMGVEISAVNAWVRAIAKKIIIP